jgi:hypothetical protein
MKKGIVGTTVGLTLALASGCSTEARPNQTPWPWPTVMSAPTGLESIRYKSNRPLFGGGGPKGIN